MAFDDSDLMFKSPHLILLFCCRAAMSLPFDTFLLKASLLFVFGLNLDLDLNLGSD